MEDRKRLRNSLLNLASGFAYRLLSIFTSFAVRTVFVRCLSEDYLGVNGLYSNVLSMLSLAELGFGTAMVFSMYKPLADEDYPKMSQLAQLYRKVYRIIGSVILGLGVCLVPFLDHIIKNKPDIDGLIFYYLLFLGNSVLSYWFFAYRNSILQADQRAYIITSYTGAFNLLKSILQIILLRVFHNYTIYLLVQILCTVAQNIALAFRVKRDYPFFVAEPQYELPAEDKKAIFKDVQALMLSKVSHVILNSSDSIIISAFVGINWVGRLSNYNMVVEAITAVLTQITGALSASLGDFFAKEKRENGYKLFQRVDFINCWLYSFSSIAFIVLLNPFVTLWLGVHYTLSNGIVIALVIRFFVAGFMNTLWTFRSSLGLFTQGKYRPLIVAGINIALSICLSQIWGVAGVLAATSISRACVNLWYDPWLLHKHGFGEPIGPFLRKYIIRILQLVVLTATMMLLSHYIFWDGVTLLRFFIMVCLTAVVPNAVFFLIFRKTDEMQYILKLAARFLKKLRPER